MKINVYLLWLRHDNLMSQCANLPIDADYAEVHDASCATNDVKTDVDIAHDETKHPFFSYVKHDGEGEDD